MATLMTLTERIYDGIDCILSSEDAPGEIKNELRGYAKLRTKEKCEEQPTIPFSTIRNLQKYLRKVDKPRTYLHELLEGSEIFFPPLPKPDRNPELVERLEKLRAEQSNKEYQQMTRNVGSDLGASSSLGGVGKELRSVQSQLTSIFNVFLTIVGAFVFGFMAMYYADQSVTARVLVGFTIAMIVAVADLYFFIKNEV